MIAHTAQVLLNHNRARMATSAISTTAHALIAPEKYTYRLHRCLHLIMDAEAHEQSRETCRMAISNVQTQTGYRQWTRQLMHC